MVRRETWNCEGGRVRRVEPAVAMVLCLVAFGLGALGLAVPAWAHDTLAYGSRAGMEVDIVSVSGLDTAKASIRTRHTRGNAMAFCRDYVGKITPACIRDELAVPLQGKVTADCLTGRFTTPSGQVFRFEGPLKPKNPIAKYRIVDLSTGVAADGTSASGYSTNISIFRKLCPKHAPADE